MTEKISIRASSLSSYPDCLRRTAARLFKEEIQEAGYVLKTTRTGIGAATGTGTHSGAGFILQAKIDTGEPGQIDDAVEVALESLRFEVEPGITWDQTSPNLNTAEKQVIRQLKSYKDHIVPLVDPISVEEALEAELEAGSNIWITGHTDTKENFRVRDLKTGVLRRANGPQYGGYSLLYRSTGMEIRELIEDFIPRVSLKKEQPLPISYSYNVEEAERAAYSTIMHMIKALEAFRVSQDPWEWLANPMSMMCSDKFCPAWGTDFCKAHLQ